MDKYQLEALTEFMEEGEGNLQMMISFEKMWLAYVARPSGKERDVGLIAGSYGRLLRWQDSDTCEVDRGEEDENESDAQELRWGEFMGKAMTHGDDELTSKVLDLNDRVNQKLEEIRSKYAELLAKAGDDQ